MTFREFVHPADFHTNNPNTTIKVTFDEDKIQTKKQKQLKIFEKLSEELKILEKMHAESVENNKREGYTYYIPLSKRHEFVKGQVSDLKKNLGL